MTNQRKDPKPDRFDELAEAVGKIHFLNIALASASGVRYGEACDRAQAAIADLLRKEAAWKAIDDEAMKGRKVEVIAEDTVAPSRKIVTIAWHEDGRWWGSGLSSHWRPVLYRPIPSPYPEGAGGQ